MTYLFYKENILILNLYFYCSVEESLFRVLTGSYFYINFSIIAVDGDVRGIIEFILSDFNFIYFFSLNQEFMGSTFKAPYNQQDVKKGTRVAHLVVGLDTVIMNAHLLNVPYFTRSQIFIMHSGLWLTN